MRRIAAAVATITPLSACSSSSGRCVHFVALPTAQDRFDAAEVVVVATVVPTRRTVEEFAVQPVHRVRTVAVIEGREPASFDLTSPSDRCERRGAPVE